MNKKLWFVIIMVALVAPVTASVYHVLEGKRNATQGTIETEEWLPQNATVQVGDSLGTDWENFIQNQTGLDPKDRIWNTMMSREKYQASSDRGQSHFVCISENFRVMSYTTCFGPVVCRTDLAQITRPKYVRFKSKQYMGKGKFVWEIDSVDYFGAIAYGLIIGIMFNAVAATTLILAKMAIDTVRERTGR